MAESTSSEPEAIERLEERLRAGDESVLADLFTLHRSRVWQLVHFRLDDRIRPRIDADDVVQEVYLAACSRIEHFVAGDFPTFFLWLRLVAVQTLSNVHRTHVTTEARSVSKEAPPRTAAPGAQTSMFLTRQFVAHLTSVSQVVGREELLKRVRRCIDGMNEIDREVLALRHFEELTNQEVASVLSIKPKAASIRYMRALDRLRSILGPE